MIIFALGIIIIELALIGMQLRSSYELDMVKLERLNTVVGLLTKTSGVLRYER